MFKYKYYHHLEKEEQIGEKKRKEDLNIIPVRTIVQSLYEVLYQKFVDDRSTSLIILCRIQTYSKKNGLILFMCLQNQ